MGKTLTGPKSPGEINEKIENYLLGPRLSVLVITDSPKRTNTGVTMTIPMCKNLFLPFRLGNKKKWLETVAPVRGTDNDRIRRVYNIYIYQINIHHTYEWPHNGQRFRRWGGVRGFSYNDDNNDNNSAPVRKRPWYDVSKHTVVNVRERTNSIGVVPVFL